MRTDRIGDVEVEVLAEQEGSESYEWSVAALVRHEGRLYLYDESGCSCSGPWEYSTLGLADLMPVASWQEAANHVQAAPPLFFDPTDVAAFAEKCMAAMRP